jgi:hypothetical protein
MVPSSIAKAIHTVLKAVGVKNRPAWSQFARLESDPGSDLFMFEATDCAMALTIMFSSPEFVDWGGCAWVSERDMRKVTNVEQFLSEKVPAGYPESVRQHLATMMANASPEVDVHISAYYWGVVSRVLSELGTNSHPIQLICAGPVGPLQITVRGGERDEWIEVNIFVMGLAREDRSNDSTPSP